MAKFRKAHIGEYIEWLKAYLETGRKPTHYYDYPWSRANFLVAMDDFRLGGECGADARPIIVPKNVRYIGGGLGHNNLYLLDGPKQIGLWVPVYRDDEFNRLSLQAFIAEQEDQAREFKRQTESMEDERKRRSATSDLSRYTGR